MPTRRITVEEVLEAYRVTGLKPIQGNFYHSDGCCCAIGAVAISSGAKRGCGAVCRWAETHLHPLYINGFLAGFDEDCARDFSSKQFTQGYADGTAVREAVFQGAPQ